MNSRFVSFASIVDRIYRGTEYEVIPWQDVAEDIISVLRIIGVPMSYVQKTCNGQGDNPVPVIIENFKGEIPIDVAVPGPCRLIHLDSDTNIIGFRTMIEDNNIFYQSPTLEYENQAFASTLASTIETSSLELKMDEAQDLLDDGDTTGAISAMEDVLDDIDQTKLRVYTSTGNSTHFQAKYKLNNGFMYTNFKNGFVEMTYKAFPVDEFGMPMVPDNEKFIRAVESYIIWRMDHKRWRTTRNNTDRIIAAESEKEYLWYVGAAATGSHNPTVDMMESIKNMILRSIPKINEHSNGFGTLGIGEQRKF